MKIKRKVQKTLPQLIEWAWANPKRHEIRAFIDDPRDFGSEIYVQEHNGSISIQGKFNKDDTFTVEVEEEITEDTKFDLLLDHFTTTYGHDSVGDLHRHKSINDILEENDDLGIATNSIHTFDRETNTFNLIWRNGKLVE